MLLRVQMKNCQSLKDCSFTLATDRINVIIADNGTGKSVLFKMLKMTAHPKYFDRDDRKDLIRHGAEYAAIYFEFEDGAMACTKVYPTYTMYLYKKADSGIAVPSSEPDPEMLQKVGLLSDGTTPFVANIVDSDQDLLLVNSKLRYNFNLIRMLVENAELESVKEKVQNIRSTIISPISSLSSRCDNLRSLIANSNYCDVKTRETELQRVEVAKELMYSAIEIINLVGDVQEIHKINIDFDYVENCMIVLETIEEIDLDAFDVPPSPPCIDDDLQLLEHLESLNLNELIIEHNPPDLDLEIQLLETLEKINLDELYVGDAPLDVDAELNVLADATEIMSVISNMVTNVSEFIEISDRISYLESELMQSGTVHQCEIYGRVIYNGKECIPYSE